MWCATPSRSLWQVLCLAGLAGFSTAIGIHPLIGYTDTLHLVPAVLGACLYAGGLALTFKPNPGLLSHRANLRYLEMPSWLPIVRLRQFECIEQQAVDVVGLEDNCAIVNGGVAVVERAGSAD